MVNAGPVMPNSREMALAPGVRHRLRNRHGMDAGFPHLVNVPEALIFRSLAAYARTGYDGGVLAQIAGPLDAALAHRFPRRDHRELGEAIDHVRFFRREMIVGGRSLLPPRRCGSGDRGTRCSVIGPTPQRPSRRAFWNASRLFPNPQMTPIPVTTTLRIRMRRARDRSGCRLEDSLFDQRAHSFHHVANAANGLHLFVGHVDVELVFQREDDVDAVHGIDPQFLETAVDRDLRGVFALRFGDDAQNASR